MPPDCPANTIEPPSGDQAGLEMAPMLALSTSMRCSTSELSTSTMTSWLSPSAIATKANSCPSGDQEPEESRKRSASMCASEAALDSLRMILPVRASAMNRSTEKRSRSEMKATYRPSGLTEGATFWLPAPVEGASSRAPTSPGARRPAISGRYSLSIAWCQSADTESCVFPSTLTMAFSHPTWSERRYSSVTASSP